MRLLPPAGRSSSSANTHFASVVCPSRAVCSPFRPLPATYCAKNGPRRAPSCPKTRSTHIRDRQSLLPLSTYCAIPLLHDLDFSTQAPLDCSQVTLAYSRIISRLRAGTIWWQSFEANDFAIMRVRRKLRVRSHRKLIVVASAFSPQGKVLPDGMMSLSGSKFLSRPGSLCHMGSKLRNCRPSAY